MKLSELDSLIQKLNAVQEKLEEKMTEQEQAKKSVHEMKEEAERLKKLSLITGKTYDLETLSEETQTKKIAPEISKLKTHEMELKKQIAKGMSELKFPISSPNPETSKSDAIFILEEGNYQLAIDYLKSSLSMKERLMIDNVVFYSDKIVVRGKSKPDEVTDCLMNAMQSIWSLGSIMLGQVSEKMKKTIDSLNRSKHRHLWEFIGSKGSVSLQSTYDNFRLTDETERKRARTFYSQLESLRTPPLAAGEGKGNFKLTVYGRLVWASYKKTHGIPEEKTEEAERVSEVQEIEKVQEPSKKPPQRPLQNFMKKVLLEEDD